MRRRDLSTVASADIERRLRIALSKMTTRQADIFLSIRFDRTPYEELAARHGITVNQSLPTLLARFAYGRAAFTRAFHRSFGDGYNLGSTGWRLPSGRTAF